MTLVGAGPTRDANPDPGSGVMESGRLKRRILSSRGVGRTSPKPVSVTGNGLVNSQSGGTVPGSGSDAVGAAADGAALTAGAETLGSGSRSLGAQPPSTRMTATTANRLTPPA
jgi:hypothetical protein